MMSKALQAVRSCWLACTQAGLAGLLVIFSHLNTIRGATIFKMILMFGMMLMVYHDLRHTCHTPACCNHLNTEFVL